MNGTLQSLFEDFQSNDSWTGKCVNRVYQAAQNGALGAITAGLVGQDGVAGITENSTTWKREDVWGISIDLCSTYCSRQRFPMVFNYQTFLGRLTNYLLPWLALTAQLPYEAGDVVPNVMSFFMALGSPMLITFSLMMTILNQRWFNQKCKNFEERYTDSPFAVRLRSARIFIEASQQVPIRMSHEGGWLASLIILESNATWWSRLSTRMIATRRGVTLSLVAQILVAVIAWVLTIVGSFGSSLGSHAEALVLSSSSMWTWLVPVICGWITVGTQSKIGGIEGALRADSVVCAPGTSNGLNTAGTQVGFQVAARDSTDSRNLLGSSAYGDELQPGPVFNYARIFTWRHTAQRLLSYFETAARNYSQKINLDSQPTPKLIMKDLDGDINRISAYCNIDVHNHLTEYPQGNEIDAEFWWQVVGAVIMAVFVQWGTTGPAILIAYLTDVKGLGCRSGSYLLYGVLSTCSFTCFFLSVLFSRATLLRAPTSDGTNKAWAFLTFRACALLTKLMGRLLAISSAIWIVLTSIWELIGFFDNCWCEGTALSLGSNAWVALFKRGIDLKENATGPWAGGVFMSSFVMGATYGVFWLFCYNPKES